MEPIKVEVSVQLNFSEDAKQFISTLFSSKSVNQAPAKPAAQAPAALAKPAAQAQASEQPSIEDVRKALAAKVNEHRAEIKEKLEELGAPSVTKLDPAKYSDMLDFLNSLS